MARRTALASITFLISGYVILVAVAAFGLPLPVCVAVAAPTALAVAALTWHVRLPESTASRRPLLIAAVTILLIALAAAGLLLGEYIPEGSYICQPPLEDLALPRPEPAQADFFFDEAAACWNDARARARTAAVLLPLMFLSATASVVLAIKKRSALLPGAAFTVFALAAIVTGWGTRY